MNIYLKATKKILRKNYVKGSCSFPEILCIKDKGRDLKGQNNVISKSSLKNGEVEDCFLGAENQHNVVA